MTIGDRIKQKRLELSLSQSELAVRAEYYDKTRISKIENSGNEISMKQVRRIAKALGVSSAYLMGWEGQNDTPSALNNSDDSRNLENQEFVELYQGASPEIQQAVLTLLKSAKHDS